MSETENTPGKQPTGNSNSPEKPKVPLPKKPFKPRFAVYWVWIAVLVGLVLVEVLGHMDFSERDISFQTFEQTILAHHYADRIIVVNNDIAEVYLKQEALKDSAFKELSKTASGPQYVIKNITFESFNQDLKDAEKNLNYADTEKIYPEKASRTDMGDILTYVFPIALLVLLYVFFIRRVGGGGGNQIFSIGKSKATLFDKDTNVNITFNDVAGLEEAKVEIKEIVDFLKNPQKYVALGAKIPKGALLVGPPGTGKT